MWGGEARLERTDSRGQYSRVTESLASVRQPELHPGLERQCIGNPKDVAHFRFHRFCDRLTAIACRIVPALTGPDDSRAGQWLRHRGIVHIALYDLPSLGPWRRSHSRQRRFPPTWNSELRCWTLRQNRIST